MTLQVPDDLARRIQPIAAWLPAVLELGLAKCRTRAAAAGVELIELLSRDPSPESRNLGGGS